MKKKTEKIIQEMCLKCGKKYDRKHKMAFGMWKGDCDVCGKKDVYVADAAHDFGIYSTKEIEDRDTVQDLL